MKILCTICARGGSVGVKNKNIRKLKGKPLIAHSIIQAKKSNLFDLITISSDSAKIRQVSLQWGADQVIERPSDLATATAPKLPVIQHAVMEAEKRCGFTFDFVVDLDATAPLRTVEDIVNSYQLLSKNPEAWNVITACHARKSPYFNMVELGNNGYVKLSKKTEGAIFRRQDAPICYDMNASIYVWRREALFNSQSAIIDKTLLYVMSEERSIDIDTPIDWKFVQLLARARKDL